MNTPASSNWQLNGAEDWPRGGGPYMGTNIGTLHHLEYPVLAGFQDQDVVSLYTDMCLDLK